MIGLEPTTQEPTTTGQRYDLWSGELVSAAVAMLAVALAVQWRAGAYGAEFGYDESAHYVSGLAVHDYLRAFRVESPVAFIARYHSAYPLIGIGHWGPFYYGVEALWMMIFGWSRFSVLLLTAVVTAATGALVYRASIQIAGSRVLAAMASFAFLLSPLARSATAAVLLDMPITLLCLLSMLVYARYLETDRGRYAMWFGVFATAGLLVKGNAGCLALMPPLAVALTGRWALLRRASFWLPAFGVVVVVGPWYYMTYGLIAPGFRYHFGLDYTATAIPANAEILAMAFGPLLLLAALGGIGRMLAERGRVGKQPLCACAVALFGAVIGFQAIVPTAIQDRYLLPALPPMALLAVHGIAWLRDRLNKNWIVPACAVAIFAAAMPWSLGLPAKMRFHVIDVAAVVWANRLLDNPSVLIVMDGEAEGAAIAELAMRDPARPSLFAIRGSRLLAGGGYNSEEIVPKFSTEAEVMAAIDAYAIPFVLIRYEAIGNQWAIVDLVKRTQLAQPERWSRVYSYSDGKATVALYRIRGNDIQKADIAQLRALSAPKALGGF